LSPDTGSLLVARRLTLPPSLENRDTLLKISLDNRHTLLKICKFAESFASFFAGLISRRSLRSTAT
jgi:hypothetical protein